MRGGGGLLPEPGHVAAALPGEAASHVDEIEPDPLDPGSAGAAALLEPDSQEAALQRLRSAFVRFASYQGELQPHFAYGALSHGEYAAAHVMHLYDHLSLLRLA